MPEVDGYVISREYAEIHGISPITVRMQCRKGVIPGAKKIDRDWFIPVDAKAVDRRVRSGKYIGSNTYAKYIKPHRDRAKAESAEQPVAQPEEE